MREISTIVMHASATPPSMEVDREDIYQWHVVENGEPVREFSVGGRKHVEARCQRCGDIYTQQKRVWNKAEWKGRCKNCRGLFERKKSKPTEECPDCGKAIYRGSHKCKSCAQSHEKPNCIDCGIEIKRKATRCLPCHNKKQDKGLSRERTKFQVSSAWAKVRLQSFERDDYTCARCGQRGGTLNAHHILPWATHPEHRLSLENIMTVCRPCHEAIHWGENEVD